MRTIGLHSMKNASTICKCGDYVVAIGKKLWIFRTDGSFVTQGKEIRWPHEVLVLSPEEILVVDADRFHRVSLLTGESTWSMPQTKKQRMWGQKTVLSSDRKYLYNMYDDMKTMKLNIVRICMESQKAETIVVPDSLRCTIDMRIDEEGILYALQTHQLSEDGETSQHGILRVDWRGEEAPDISWDRFWSGPREVFWNCFDGRYILRQDYSVLDLMTMESFSLLENEPEWRPTWPLSECTYIPERGLLMGYHMYNEGNVIIDCKARKRVAQYARKKSDSGAGYQGCLIDGEYWQGTDNGIVRKPFPVFEDMSETEKTMTMGAWFKSLS